MVHPAPPQVQHAEREGGWAGGVMGRVAQEADGVGATTGKQSRVVGNVPD